MKIILSFGLAIFLVAGAPQAKASFGCEVLLCLAAGAVTPKECKPVLKKLFERLAKGKGFPSCKMESGPNIGGGATNAGLPTPERGIATFVPTHKVCLQWGDRTNPRGDITGKVCRQSKVVQEHYDHSGKSCTDWFPRPPGHYKAARDKQSDPLYELRRQCSAKSKRYVRVNGAGIVGEYHYY